MKRTSAVKRRKKRQRKKALLTGLALFCASAALFFVSAEIDNLPFSANITQAALASEGAVSAEVLARENVLTRASFQSSEDYGVVGVPELALSQSALSASYTTPRRPSPTAAPKTGVQKSAAPGYAAVIIDNRFILTMKTSEEAQRALSAVMDAAKEPRLGGKVQQVSSRERVDILTQREAPDTLYSYEEAYLKLRNGPDGNGYLTLVTQELISKTEDVDYKTETVEDANMLKGESKTVQSGRDGKVKKEYLVTLEGTKETERVLKSEKVVEAPQNKIVAKGTKVVAKKTTAPSKSTSSSSSSSSSSLGKPGPNEGEIGPSASPLSFAWPVSGKVSSYFGMRWGRMHYGVDVPKSEGTPIKASESGIVTYVGDRGDYGLLVEINHGNGFATRYAHNSQNLVVKGQQVSKGDTIALIGDTGNSSTAHIHFEIRYKDTPYNPMQYLP